MTKNEISLCARLKQMGFTQGNQMKLYGQEYELLSEPIVLGDDLVFLDASEKKSGRPSRVRIPLLIVKMASGERSAA
jgi:hypothetical protein